MLTISKIREERSRVVEGLEKRNFTEFHLIDAAIEHDDLRKSTQQILDATLAELNSISKQIGLLFKAGKQAEANELKTKTVELKQTAKQLEDKLKNAKDKLLEILYQIPNIPHTSVKKGMSEEDNEIVFENDRERKTGEGLIPHWEICEKYNLVSFELGVKITGAGYPVYLGKGAKLQRALIQYFLDVNSSVGYQEVIPPFLVNEASGYGTGQLPDKEGQMYEIANNVSSEQLYLIPTSEVPVTNIYRDDLLQEKQLPILHTAYSPCFRREAGSYGKDVRGLNRLHQFEKVELVRIEKPEDSYKALDQMVEHVKAIMEDLELPYRILRLCGGDTGFASALTYDFEVWSAAQQRWLEVSSVSNFEDFQANRLKLRYKSVNGNQLCHTLNGSALALPRVMAGILETHQTDKGIKIPEKLISYTGFEYID